MSRFYDQALIGSYFTSLPLSLHCLHHSPWPFINPFALCAFQSHLRHSHCWKALLQLSYYTLCTLSKYMISHLPIMIYMPLIAHQQLQHASRASCNYLMIWIWHDLNQGAAHLPIVWWDALSCRSNCNRTPQCMRRHYNKFNTNARAREGYSRKDILLNKLHTNSYM